MNSSKFATFHALNGIATTWCIAVVAVAAATADASSSSSSSSDISIVNDDKIYRFSNVNVRDYGEFLSDDDSAVKDSCRILREIGDPNAPIVLYGKRCRCNCCNNDNGDGSTTDETTPTTSSTTTQSPSTCPIDTDGETVNVPHETDCDAYYKCSPDGKSKELQRCRAGDVFNPNLQICDSPLNVDCGDLRRPPDVPPPSSSPLGKLAATSSRPLIV